VTVLKKQEYNAEASRFRKVLFSLSQIIFFTAGILEGKSRFGPRVVVGDWPHSKSPARYLILGTAIIAEDKIFVENWGKLYRLGACPQKEFFRKLNCGEDIRTDPYYIESKERLDSSEFDAWLHLKLELWRNFNKDPRDFTAIAVRRSMRRFLVQDGAHRLSLSSLRGSDSHVLGIGLWDYQKRQ
jgi:hypothetical protein